MRVLLTIEGILYVIVPPNELEEQVKTLHAMGEIYDDEDSLRLFNEVLDSIVGRNKPHS